METWILIAVLAFVAAGVIKGTLGIGLPISAIGLMSQFIDPRTAIALTVFPITVSNFWQLYRSGQVMQSLRRYGLFASVLIVVLLVTTVFTPQVPTRGLLGLVGGAIVLFSLLNLAFTLPILPQKFDSLAQLLGGAAAGILGGLTAIWAPSIAAYLIARNTTKEEFVRGTGFLFSAGSLPLCLGFWQNGMLTGPIASLSSAMILPALVGYYLGEKLRDQLDGERFKKLVLVFFLLIGLNLIRKSVMG